MDATDHPALLFLNTASPSWGDPIELLGSGIALLAWLLRARLLDEEDRARLRRQFTRKQLDDAAAQARELREWLRIEVEAWAGGAEVSATMVKRLNRGLADDPQLLQLAYAEGGVELQLRREWYDAGQLLAPVLVAAADLVARVDPHLVRVCDGPGCGIWFYDRTRSHRRRWCSQAVCGNRDKVRNYRARTRRHA